MKVTAIIPAAGSGKRINAKKQFLELLGKPIIAITVSVFEECQNIDDIIVVVGKDDIDLTGKILKAFKKVKHIIEGGDERQDSVYNGISAIKPESDDDIVVIHDGVRPLVTKELLAKAVTEVKVSKAAVVGVPAKDTIKTISNENIILETLDRKSIWQIQTPQAFKYTVIKEAYERAKKVGYSATDDSKLVERLGIPVKMIMGSYQNIKITTEEDLPIAEAIIKGRGQ